MDITIKHKSGKCNSNADALSRYPSDFPVPSNEDQNTESCVTVVQQCAEADFPPDLAKVSSYQQEDPEMASMFAYLVNGILPEGDKVSRRLVLESKHGVLYRENSVVPGRWCLVVPKELRTQLLTEPHQSIEKFDRLRRQYWWKGMKRDVTSFCRSCLVCASRKGGHKTFKLPLAPIPVGGPFHRATVDILQLPLAADGNRHVAVFMDYLTKWPEVFPMADQKAETIAKHFVEGVVCRHNS